MLYLPHCNMGKGLHINQHVNQVGGSLPHHHAEEGQAEDDDWEEEAQAIVQEAAVEAERAVKETRVDALFADAIAAGRPRTATTIERRMSSRRRQDRG